MLVRPEEGSSLRSQLVRLMTSPVSEVKVLAAHLLFVLCKEDGMGPRDWHSVGHGRRWLMCSERRSFYRPWLARRSDEDRRIEIHWVQVFVETFDVFITYQAC